jgi:hypothetical protein
VSIPFWSDDPTAWDRLYIAGTLAPGIVRDINVVRSRKVQKNAGPGIDGASLVSQGRNLAEVPIVLELFTRNHLARAEAFVAERLARLKDEGAVTFAHPLLTLHQLSALYIEEFDGPKRVSEGIYQMTIKATEYRPPPKVNATAKVVAPMPNALTNELYVSKLPKLAFPKLPPPTPPSSTMPTPPDDGGATGD